MRAKTSRILSIAVTVIFVYGQFGCSAPSNRANILPAEVQYMADTMFSHHKRAVTKEMDSLCYYKTPQLIATIRDSLILVEKESIDKILGRG